MGAPEEIKFPPEEEEKEESKYQKYINGITREYLYLESKDIDKSIEIRPEDRRLFYLLFKEAKLRLYNGIGAGARQAELIIIYWGNKKLCEILSQYDIIPIIQIYDKLLLYFDEVPGIRRVPVLNLSTVFNNQREDSVYVHTQGDLHGEFCERSELFNITIGDLTMIGIILFFSDIFSDEHFGNYVTEYIRIEDRLKRAIEEYRNYVAMQLLVLVPELEQDIKNYRREVEDGDGDIETLKEKEMILKKILRKIRPESEAKTESEPHKVNDIKIQVKSKRNNKRKVEEQVTELPKNG